MTANPIRLIALDMDGTLLRDDKTFSRYTRQVLQALSDRGLMLVPATGRVRNGLTENILTLPSVSYAICANGAYIEDLKNDQVLASWLLDREQTALMAEYLQNFPVYFYVHTAEGTFRQSALDLSRLKNQFPFLSFPEDSFCNLAQVLRREKLHPLKLGILAPDAQIFHQLLNDPLPVSGVRRVCTGPVNIEINSVSASKGTALEWLCRRLNIPLDRTLAIGDNQNDIEMLRAAGVSAAMENGPDEVKQNADFICPSNQEDGAARFLAEFFGLEGLGKQP